MCIAIYQDAGSTLTEQEIRNSWNANPDGGGLAYIDDCGKVCTFKSMKLKGLLEEYERVVDMHGQHSPMLVHFRIATHGTVNEYNCHPFMVNKNIAMIHNGVIPVLIDKKDKRSDTRVFTEEYLPKLPKGWLDDDYLFDMVQEYIGHSKLVFLSTENRDRAYIANEHMGHWNPVKTIWFSNKSYCSVSSMFSKYNPNAKWQQPSMADSTQGFDPYTYEEDPAIGQCKFCTGMSVYDGVCYECEICQSCSMTDDYCTCYTSIANMTDEQWKKFSTPV
jgi:hypothetical protein